jgi:iron complex outermembrane receptor protein
MNRNFLQVEQKYSFSERDELKALMFYSSYGYKTPGGLTYDQMVANPRAARYSTPVMPGAIEQRASVRNEMVFGVLSNGFRITDNISHVLSVFGSRVNFGNTAIANIEDKTENTSGFRTFVEVTDKNRKTSAYRWDTGLELQQTNAKIRNFANAGGKPDSSLGSNRLNVTQYFFFTRFYIELLKRINLEAAISLDNFQYRFGAFEESSPLTRRKFDMQVMPKVALSYKFTDNLALRVSASRGFSPPTIDEIRSNDNIVNTDLQPENGWNYETGVRFRERRNRFWGEALVFKYKLENAIVRRMNPDNTEFFENVGGTDQLGFEAALNAWIVEPRESGFIRDFQLRSSYTYSAFKFYNYIQLNNDYSGNRLTGVPEQIITSSLNITFPAGFFLFVQHNYTSGIPLNDANTEYSDPYNLVGMRIGCNIKARQGNNIEVFVLADNLLNERYSLGNDLNAIGKRYYNPSPVRNYSAGLSLTF